MNKTVSIIITLSLILAVGIIFSDSGTKGTDQAVQNSVIKDGVQYITIEAKGDIHHRLVMPKLEFQQN